MELQEDHEVALAAVCQDATAINFVASEVKKDLRCHTRRPLVLSMVRALADDMPPLSAIFLGTSLLEKTVRCLKGATGLRNIEAFGRVLT